MTHQDLDEIQKTALRQTFCGWRDFLDRLLIRMAETEFPSDDPLRQRACCIHDDLVEIERLLATRPPSAHGK